MSSPEERRRERMEGKALQGYKRFYIGIKIAILRKILLQMRRKRSMKMKMIMGTKAEEVVLCEKAMLKELVMIWTLVVMMGVKEENRQNSKCP